MQTLDNARDCLETAMFLYDEIGHPNAAHIRLMLADHDADDLLNPGPRQAVMVRKYPNVGPWKGGC